MTKRDARKIARLYLGSIAVQDDAFYVPGLSDEDNMRVNQQIKAIGVGLIGPQKGQVGFTQPEIVSHVLGTPVESYPDSPW